MALTSPSAYEHPGGAVPTGLNVMPHSQRDVSSSNGFSFKTLWETEALSPHPPAITIVKMLI